MLVEIFNWFISCIGKVITLTRSFILDSSSGITFFHFLIFVIFIRILFYLLEFIRQITITSQEDSDIIKNKGRYKK